MTTCERRAILVTCWLTASAFLGCSTLRPAASAPPESEAGQGEWHGAVIPVAIQNDNMQDLNIYVLHGGMRTRIGIAGAAQATAFTFPAHYSSGATTIRIAAVPLIGGRFGWRKSIISDAVVVHAGQRIVFSLESDLARSTIAVYAMNVVDPADSTAGRDSSTSAAAGGTSPPLR